MHPKKDSIIQSDLHRESIKGLTSNKNFVITGLQVTAGSGLAVNISAGSCIVGGVYIEFYTSVLTVPASTTSEIYVELILDANKPTNATITYTTGSFTPSETRLWLASITTNAYGVTSITDRRVYRITGTKNTYTSSGFKYFNNSWIYAIVAGGGGGGRSSVPSGYNATGGCGGEISVDIAFHHGGTIVWMIGAGGSPGSSPTSGGTSSISYISNPLGTSESISANGGAGGQQYTGNISTYSYLKYHGALILFESQVYSGPTLTIHSTIVPAYQVIATGTNTKTYIGAYASVVGTPVVGVANSVVASNSVSSAGVTLSSGGASSTGTGGSGSAGKIIAYIWEI